MVVDQMNVDDWVLEPTEITLRFILSHDYPSSIVHRCAPCGRGSARVEPSPRSSAVDHLFLLRQNGQNGRCR